MNALWRRTNSVAVPLTDSDTGTRGIDAWPALYSDGKQQQ